jgi:hypothetical protein
MSPKTTSSKNKKESKDPKRVDSSNDPDLFPTSHPDGLDTSGRDVPTDTDSKFRSSEHLDDVKEEQVNQDFVNQDEEEGTVKCSEYFDPLATIMIKVFCENKQIVSVPMLLRNIIEKKKDELVHLKTISKVISKIIDSELNRIGVSNYIRLLREHDEDHILDIRVESFHKNSALEFNLTEENYRDIFVITYNNLKMIPIHVHLDKYDINVTQKNNVYVAESRMNKEVEVNEAKVKLSPPMFRGVPIDMSDVNVNADQRGFKISRNDLDPAYISSHHRGRIPPSSRDNTAAKISQSPISVYDDDDYLVQNPQFIVPFAQESMITRINDLQSIATTTIPDVTSIPKLLRSHNVSFKKDDNATTWYLRFHNFCAMIGIYLTPTKAMTKTSEMGREWDNVALPKVLYSRFPKMEKVLTHILFAPDFFPKELQDDLQLNPQPYNFLRLFMATNSHAVPELSDQVIKRPGVMRSSQSLSQYALLWVNYFLDEATVNGVRYSKFRQYCYFLDGLPQRYSIFRKFLDMEFDSNHDKVDSIPITLELRNLPSTIQSLANIHGINLTNSGNIHQITSDSLVDCHSDDGIDHIKSIDLNKKIDKNFPSPQKKVQFASSTGSKVQCWLCDGPHGFRQCKDLDRMKSVCKKRPSVLKHFQQLVLDKNSEGIRILMDAPELFDDLPFDQSKEPQSNDNSSDDQPDDNINSLHIDVLHALPEDTSPLFDTILSIRDPSFPSCFTDHGENILSIHDPLALENVQHVSHGSIPQVQVDGGADRSITPHRELVHNLRPPNPLLGEKTHINDAGVHSHKIIGYGHFRVKCLDSNSNQVIVNVPCAYIPSIPSTLLNFRTMPRLLDVHEISNMLLGIGAAHLMLFDDDDNPYKLVVPLIVYKTRLYADDVLEICVDSHNQPSDTSRLNSDYVHLISDEPTRLLWHSRLGHLNFRSLSEMHKYADGIPRFKQPHSSEHCSTCLISKLRRSPRGYGTIATKATVHGQILCADWGFICQKSSDPTRITRLSSVYGDTSYLIFTCAHTGALYGVCARSKSVPTKWLHIFLHRISASIKQYNKHIIVDRGSELGRSHEFKHIAESHGYLIYTSGPDKSSMNGMAERPHSTIGDALRSILHASGLDLKYWNFTFYHYIRLYNLVPHGDRTDSPFTMVKGYRPDISHLRIFGCDVFIRPPGRRNSKLDLHGIRGRFLGYTSTLKQIYYLEYSTNKIKIAAHARFDEGMSSVPPSALPPFAVQLRKSLGQTVPELPAGDTATPLDLDLLTSPLLFPVTFPHKFLVKQSDIHAEFDTLGFVLKDDTVLKRCYVADILPRSSAAAFPRWRTRLIGSFILCIDNEIIFDSSSAAAALSRRLVDASSTREHTYVTITFASDNDIHREPMVDNDPSPIQLDQICHISSLIETGEESKYQPCLDMDWVKYFDDLVNRSLTIGNQLDSDDAGQINKVSSSQFTRRQLMSQPGFDEWLQAEFKQLDRHALDGMFGDPCPRPHLAIVLRSIWSYSIKWDGSKKARHCCDGRPLRDDQFRRMESIYTACISQVGMKIYIALVALLNYVILDLDAVNAFGQAGSLYDIIYLEIDQQFRDWYKAKNGKEIPIGWVLPVKGSLQGHPDSGEIWQTKVNEVLDRYKFTTTTHEPCLYRGLFRDKQILICRQVDDMLIAGEDISIVREFALEISKHLNVTIGEEPSTHYNGLDILQTREGIKISCGTYIRKLQKAHGWNEVSPRSLEPIDPNKVRELESNEGPNIDSPEGEELRKRNGFNYRGVVGEIVYAYITCRPDYAFAVSLLSRFNTCPAQCHYDAAKRCLKSLIRSADEGIWYWRRSNRMEFPSSTHVPRKMEEFEKKFPILKDPFLVSGICDVSIAPGILMRRSFGGTLVFLGNLYLIMYVAKLQPIIASSSGEGEFVQLVLTGKKVKHARTVMNEFGHPQNGPSPIFGDNLSSIMMANNVRPTDRTRHMDIRWFALQEWIHVDKDIIVIHISGIINPSDALTKALAWLKHSRHMSRAMGHLGSPFAPGLFRLEQVPNESIHALFIVPS